MNNKSLFAGLPVGPRDKGLICAMKNYKPGWTCI